MKRTDQQIVEAYVALQRLEKDTPAFERQYWAWEEMMALAEREPERAFGLILQVLACDSSDRVLPALAAGPLEELLSRHGRTLLGKVEEEARRNPDFMRLLNGVWQSWMEDDVWRRIEALRGSRPSA